MKHFSILVFLLIAGTHLLFAQKQGQEMIDSLLTALERTRIDTIKVDILNELGKNNFNIGNYELAMEQGEKALALAQTIQHKKGMILAYNTIGLIYDAQGNIPEALKAHFTSGKISEEIGHKDGIAVFRTNIGLIHHQQGNYSEALKNHQASLKIYEEIKDKDGIADAYNNIANIFFVQQNYPEALKNYQKALKIKEDLGNKYGISTMRLNIGLIHHQQANYTEALKNYQIALKISEEIDDKEGIVYIYSSMGFTYLNGSKFQEAKAYMQKCLQLSKEIGLKAGIQNTYLGLAIADSALGNYKSAYENHKLYTLYKDSMFNEENTRKFTQAEMNHEFEKTQDSVKAVTDKQIAVRDATLAANKRQKYFYVAGIFGLAAIGGLLYNQSRLRKKKNRELDEANKVKARFFSILSHDLRAPIASLSSYIYLLNEEEDTMDSEVKKAHQNKIGTATNNLLVTMEDILLWSKSQMERFEPNKKNVAVSSLFNDVQKLIPADIDVDISFQNPNRLELYTDENYLKTIMRNLTANAIKALKGRKGAKIEWKAFARNGKKYLSITDNGPGLTNEQKVKLFDEDAVVSTKTGLGLHLVRDLINMLQHRLEVSSEQGSGTSFTIEIS